MPHVNDVSSYSKKNFKYKSFAKSFPKGIKKIINNYIGSSGSEWTHSWKKRSTGQEYNYYFYFILCLATGHFSLELLLLNQPDFRRYSAVLNAICVMFQA